MPYNGSNRQGQEEPGEGPVDRIAQRLGALERASSVDVVLCVISFMLASCSGWILNGSMYAYVATYCGIAREIATLFSAAFFLALFAVATRRPALIDRRIVTVVALGCLITALLVLQFALRLEDGPATIVGFLFSNAGSTWSACLLAVALCSLHSPTSMLLAVVGGEALGEVLRSLLPMPSYNVGVVAVMACSALTILMLYRTAGTKLDSLSQGASPANLELANPESFLQPTHALFLCAFLFSVATGYELTLNEVAHAPVSSDLVAVALAGVALWMLLGSEADGGREDTLFSFSVLLVIAGFLVAPFTFVNGLPSANALQRIGVECFNMLAWLVVLSVGRRNLFALLPTFALLRCAMALGTDVGAVAGHTSNDLVGANEQAAALIAAVALFAFIAFLWVGFRKFSFAETIRGVAGIGPDVHTFGNAASDSDGQIDGERHCDGRLLEADKPLAEDARTGSSTGAVRAAEGAHGAGPDTEGGGVASSIEERCGRLGKEHGLTERETEIFAMLARGRNGQYVMEHYVISRNTVKSHVKHIYAKLDIHSQQELIDLVERNA